MGSLSNREKEIMLILIRADRYVSAEEIAKILHVSNKTVYRDLQSITKKMDKSVICRQPGKGYYVNKDAVSDTYSSKIADEYFIGMDSEKRRCHLMVLLLLQTPKKTSINRLSEYYYVSNASIVNDLNDIEKKVKQYDLKLVRAHIGTYIEGTEANIRKALMKLLGYSFDFFQENAHINKETYTGLFKEFSQEDIFFIERLLKDIEEMLDENIREPYYINIFTHLIILIKRLNRYKENDFYETVDQKSIEFQSPDILSIAKTIMQKIAEYTKLDVPEIETFYIYQYLISSGIKNEKVVEFQKDSTSESKEEAFIGNLVQRVSEKVSIPFNEDASLKNNLLLHIQPLTKRIQYGIAIHNPLLEEIKKEFSEIFATVQVCIEEQDVFPEFKKLSQDEIGYIAVYFQTVLENKLHHKRILIVCSSGVGTSHLLGARVKRTFPEWKIVDIVSAVKINQARDWNTVDLILTTVHLEKQKVPAVLVSAVFGEVDVIRVKNALVSQNL
jgi:activator of the mannose operon, transcriptional antiterminator